MNGLEALDIMIERFDGGGYHPATLGCKEGAFKEVFSEELPIIERELKVNKILKKKNVNLQFISYKVLGCGYSAQELLEEYNAFAILNNLTLKEMELIVKWLKEE